MERIKSFKLEPLFGLNIYISAETFGKQVSTILKERASEPTQSWLDKVLLSIFRLLMEDYKTMLESKVIDVGSLTKLLSSIVDVCIHAYGEVKGLQDSEAFLELEKTLIRKNADYGNASIKYGGLVGNYTRLTDKLSRLLNLSTKKEVNFESVADTWLDAAGYATIGLIILQLTVDRLQGDVAFFSCLVGEGDSQESESTNNIKEIKTAPEEVRDIWTSKNIASVFYGVLPSKKTTICEIILKNGFSIVGTSACVDVRNFNEQLGQKLAFNDAYQKVEEFEAYLRQQALYEVGALV